MKQRLTFKLALITLISLVLLINCSKKSDPTPTTTTTTGTTSSTTTSSTTSGTTSTTTSGTTTSSTTSTTTSGTTTSNATCSTTDCFKFNDGSSNYSSSNITATKSGNNIIITAPTGATDYPTVYLYIITNGSTGTFTSSYATIKYDISTTYNSVSGGSFSTTISSNTATGSAGTFTFTGKLGANSKTVTGSFNVVY